ncbi:hypothetical protein I4U23_013501 [Adineta vaga]|nr:hypothetical protein I4U23_013501 [Adineta vaga]
MDDFDYRISEEVIERPCRISVRIEGLQIPLLIVEDRNVSNTIAFGQDIPYNPGSKGLFIARTVVLILILSVCGWSMRDFQPVVIKYTEKHDQLVYETYNRTYEDLITEDENNCFLMNSMILDNLGVEMKDDIVPSDIYNDLSMDYTIVNDYMTKVPHTSTCIHSDLFECIFTKWCCAKDMIDGNVSIGLLKSAYSTSDKATIDSEGSFCDDESKGELVLAYTELGHFFEQYHPAMSMSDSLISEGHD